MKVENFGVKHIGFILDGNGRWAKKRGKERLYGHKMGVEAVRRTIDACLKYEIKYVSLYCFSTENWKRDKYEVDGIFKLLENIYLVFIRLPTNMVLKCVLKCFNNFGFIFTNIGTFQIKNSIGI